MGGSQRRFKFTTVLSYLLLFSFFAGLYFGWGIALGKAGAYGYLNAALNADHERVISDLTDVNGYHGRTDVHPLFVLFLNPIGLLLSKSFGSALTAAVLINSVAGALCVVLAYAFFKRSGLNGFTAAAFATILGFSATHLFFGSTPETWIFAAAGVVLLFFLALVRPGRTSAFLPAGIFAVGMLTSNLAPAVIAFGAGIYKRVSGKLLLAKVFFFGLAVTACVAVLSVLQKLLYPSSTVFFLPGVYRNEFSAYAPIIRYWGELGPGYFSARTAELIGVMFLYNVVAPDAVVRWYSAGKYCLPLRPFVNVDLPGSSLPGLFAAAFWLALLIWAGYSFVRHRENREPVLIGLLLTVLFYVAFYLIYGTTLYVYAISTAFPLLAAAALALRPYDRPGTKRYYVLAATLTCFVVLLMANNLYFMWQIYAVFHSYGPPALP
jgi:hypothetical protein